MAKIVLVEIDSESESKMIEGFISGEKVSLKCKILEMHKDIDFYKKHISEEQKETRTFMNFEDK